MQHILAVLTFSSSLPWCWRQCGFNLAEFIFSMLAISRCKFHAWMEDGGAQFSNKSIVFWLKIKIMCNIFCVTCLYQGTIMFFGLMLSQFVCQHFWLILYFFVFHKYWMNYFFSNTCNEKKNQPIREFWIKLIFWDDQPLFFSSDNSFWLHPFWPIFHVFAMLCSGFNSTNFLSNTRFPNIWCMHTIAFEPLRIQWHSQPHAFKCEFILHIITSHWPANTREQQS